MVFVEDPLSRIVAVHWKEDDDGGPINPGEGVWPCGAFRHGYALYDEATGITHYGNVPGNSIFILTAFNIYGIGFDQNPDRKPYQPYNYWWTTADYLPRPYNSRDVPYLWAAPGSWTLTVDVDTVSDRLARRGITLHDVFIQEFRNINIQTLEPVRDPVVPDREVASNTITIQFQTGDEIYPPGFRVMYTAHTFGGSNEFKTASAYPPTLIQAHCEHETTGDYPPRPPQLANKSVPYQYPADGRDYWPIRPPPPPPYE